MTWALGNANANLAKELKIECSYQINKNKEKLNELQYHLRDLAHVLMHQQQPLKVSHDSKS